MAAALPTTNSRSGALPPLKIASRSDKSAGVTVSSSAMPTRPAPSCRRLIRRFSASAITLSAVCPSATVIVSKKYSDSTAWPSCRKPLANALAWAWTRPPICRSPSGPWYTAYIEVILASNAWAVQMLLVALSRRMCCSRVCNVSRRAGRPFASLDTPTIRPGRRRLYLSRVAMNAACGPP